MPDDEELTPDAVVVVPGIMGSALALTSTGKTVWGFDHLSWYARAWLGHSLDVLMLDEDERRGAYGRISPTSLLNFSAFGPFLRGAEPYTDLLDMIEKVVCHRGAILPFAYDWRLPVAYSAALLHEAAKAHLEAWRQHDAYLEYRRNHPGSREARIVFVAHSMGGLLVRAIAGSDLEVRALITLATPFGGSVKAARILGNGETNLPFPNAKMRALGRTLPGLYDLLPLHRCVDLGVDDDPRALGVDDVVAIGGDPGLADDSFTAMRELRKQPIRWPHVVLVGTSQPTDSSLTIREGRLSVDPRSYRFGEDGSAERDAANHVLRVRRYGDGTVAVSSAIEISPVHHSVLPQQHGPIVTTQEGLEAVRHVLLELVPGATLGAGDLGFEAPDVVEPNTAFTVEVHGVGGAQEATLTVLEAEVPGAESALLQTATIRAQGDTWVAAVDPLPAGIYRVRLDGSAFSAVTQLLLVGTEPGTYATSGSTTHG